MWLMLCTFLLIHYRTITRLKNGIYFTFWQLYLYISDNFAQKFISKSKVKIVIRAHVPLYDLFALLSV